MNGEHAKRKAWHLVADIGGTNARFAVAETASNRLLTVRQYSVAEHHTFVDAVAHFLADVGSEAGYRALPEAACLALACPVHGDSVRLTNSPWQVDRGEIGTLLGEAPVELINDFAAVGYAVTDLRREDWVEICPGETDPAAPVVVLGPGTGLGVCTVVPCGAGWRVLAGEGGHVDFAAVDAVEIALLEALSARHGRVSVERVLSGAGLENIYRVLAARRGQELSRWPTAADIAGAAVAGTDELALETLHVFCRSLGSHAGNLALTLGARGGVYIAGGIVPRFQALFLDSGFRQRYLAKGRFGDYLSTIPVRLITRDNPGLVGAATRLTQTET